jgi:UPF0755 protein
MPLFKRSGGDGHRTAADREAARLERERRRARREGREPPEELLPSDEPLEAPRVAPIEPSAWEPFAGKEQGEDEPGRNEPTADEAAADEPAAEERDAEEPDADEPRAADPFADEPVTDEPAFVPGPEPPEPAPEPERVEEPDPEPLGPPPPADERGHEETDRLPPLPPPDDGPSHRASAEQREPTRPHDPQATQPLEPVGAASGSTRRTVSLPRPQTDELGHHTDSWDQPIGTVRVSRSDYQAQPGAPGMPPHRRIGVPRTRRGVRRLIAALAFLVIVAVLAFAYLLFQPFHGDGHGAVAVTIPPGSSAEDIGNLLADKGVVDSGFFFALRARLGGDRDNLHAGTYTLKKSMSYGGAISALTASPEATPTLKITLPEGPSRREIAARVKAAGISGDYMTASERSARLDPRAYGAPRGTRSLEGFLFPATYELRRNGATSKRLVGDQVDAFEREFRQVSMRRAKRRNLSRYDVLTIASMIEREALVPKDRKLISAVIYNRLEQGIPIGIDATLRYRLGNWTTPLKQSELRANSAYNTRERKGLPPTPIGNPGLASIKAAANPAHVGYLYYVVKPCGNGAHAFSSTDAKFQKDVAAYNRARAKNGGKDPSHCSK